MDAEPEVHAFSDERAISDKVEPELRRGVKIHKILQKFGRLWASSVAATVGRSVGRKKKTTKKQKNKKKHSTNAENILAAPESPRSSTGGRTLVRPPVPDLGDSGAAKIFSGKEGSKILHSPEGVRIFARAHY